MIWNTNSNWSWGNPPQPASNAPPSPLPPWQRPTMSPNTQVLVDNTVAQIVLDPDITFLNQPSPDSPLVVNTVALPNGNNVKQTKRIFIPSQTIATSATWLVKGTFAGGFTTLQFDRLGFNALLEWEGSAWSMIGGNATLQP